MSFQLHEWDIHIVWPGTGGARVTQVRLDARVAARHVSKLSDNALERHHGTSTPSEQPAPNSDEYTYIS
jgi:hypothetical protein